VPGNTTVKVPVAVALLLIRMELAVPNVRGSVAGPSSTAALLLTVILVVLAMLATVVPLRIPGPATGTPTARVDVLFRPVIRFEPLVKTPLSPYGRNEMVVPAGMPGPLTG